MSEETKTVASETVSEQPTQESSTESTDVGVLIAESKKYRKRSQDAEARIAKMEKTMAKAEETKLKEKEDFKSLYEKVSSENESLSSVAEKWTKYEETRRASLLESHPEEDRESLANLPLDTLEFVTNKINNVQNKQNAKEVVGRTKNVVTTKPFSEMTEAEKRQWHKDVMSSQN
tara:strand:+ start:89 stop:613 length:525 start_codon:yes stop_codon:yes gene_type:complete